MYKKEIKRKWLVDLNKIDNLNIYKCDYIKYGCLSQQQDSLNVSVLSINNDDFNLILKDSGLKSRNNIIYNISKEEFQTSFTLSGSKVLTKKRYYIPSSFDEDKIISLDVFDKFDFVIAEFESDNEIIVDIFREEDWFIKEITDDKKFYSSEIVYNKLF